MGGGLFGRCPLGARQLDAVPFGRRTFGRRFELWRKNNEAGNSLNAVEREPVPTRVLNPNASEASYKPKQRTYWKTKLKKPAIVRRRVLAPDSPGAQTAAPKRARPI